MSSELREITAQDKLAEWAGKITACRNSGQPVKTWCKENGVCEQTYYKWLKRLVTMAQEQQKVQFAEVTPSLPARSGNVAVTIRLAGAEADICNGAIEQEIAEKPTDQRYEERLKQAKPVLDAMLSWCEFRRVSHTCTEF